MSLTLFLIRGWGLGVTLAKLHDTRKVSTSLTEEKWAQNLLWQTLPPLIKLLTLIYFSFIPCRQSQAPSSTEILLDEIQCSSFDIMLSSCQHDGFGNNNCAHSEDVAVSCSYGGEVVTHVE